MNPLRASKSSLFLSLTVIILLVASLLRPAATHAQAYDPTPPETVVKLIFIHHSTGEAWLADDHGGLGLALDQNNYFVSDTNYGWGPDSIGDRTDIVNWLEWFRGPETGRYMAALYNESEQHSSYTRTLPDPGGENEVILIKSCFPNSNIEGHPNDPPEAQDDTLSVSNAKYIYNDLLDYFRTRPDKLFVVITAPPLLAVNTSPENSANARAFNNWLVNDWLAENNYPYPNVAVFDFYTVLTDPDNHHRFNNGVIEHVTGQGGNNSYYPSDSSDDHPNATGDRKATQEFIPLLNIFYHRWKAGSPVQPPPTEAAPPAPTETVPGVVPPPVTPGGVIDSFDGAPPPDTTGWEALWDESTQTVITCSPTSGSSHAGSAALQIDFNVTANSWGTCALLYSSPRDWSAAQGLSFYLHASQPALVFDVNLYAGAPDTKETYLFTLETPPESVDGWAFITLSWDQFLRAAWEADAGAPFANPGRVVGLAVGFNTYPDTPNVGTIWVDDIQLMGEAIITPPPTTLPLEPTAVIATPLVAAPTQPALLPATPATGAGSEEQGGGKPRLCGGAAALPLALVGVVLLRRRRNAGASQRHVR